MRSPRACPRTILVFAIASGIALVHLAPADAQTTPTSSSAPATAADVKTSFAALQRAIATATDAAAASSAPQGPDGRAQATSYVDQLAQLNLGVQLLALDPDHPVLFRDPDPLTVPGTNPPVRSGIYSPDNISYIAIVDGTKQYTLTGKRGNSDDFSFQAISGLPGAGTTGTPTASLLKNQVAVGADGRYTIDIGPDAGTGTHLATVPQTTIISVREAFNDWAKAVPDQLSLQAVGATGKQPTTLSNQQLVTALDAATAAVAQQGPYWIGLWQQLMSSFPANQLRTPMPTQGGLAGQLSSLSAIDLPEGQALVVTVGKSEAAYQGFEIADAFGQTLPYGTHTSSLNATQATVGSDGRLHFVVSPRDPGVPNWIDTQGRTRGLLFLRWQGLPAPLPADDAPTGQLVPISSVRAVLPADTPTVSPSQRKAEQATRSRALAVRLRSSSNQARVVIDDALHQLMGVVGTKPVLAIYAGSSLSGKKG
jgi:hypothetical protein